MSEEFIRFRDLHPGQTFHHKGQTDHWIYVGFIHPDEGTGDVPKNAHVCFPHPTLKNDRREGLVSGRRYPWGEPDALVTVVQGEEISQADYTLEYPLYDLKIFDGADASTKVSVYINEMSLNEWRLERLDYVVTPVNVEVCVLLTKMERI